MKEKRTRGRPSGPSGKYLDDAGKPIGVYEFRKLKPRIETEIKIKISKPTYDFLIYSVNLTHIPMDIIVNQAIKEYLANKLKS
jgi:hypothetical protein